MIVRNKNKGYYCVECNTNYDSFSDIPTKCLLAECVPTKGDMLREKVDNMRKYKVKDFDPNDIRGIPDLKEVL